MASIQRVETTRGTRYRVRMPGGVKGQRTFSSREEAERYKALTESKDTRRTLDLVLTVLSSPSAFDGLVYYGIHHTGLVKIGYTSQNWRRFYQLKTEGRIVGIAATRPGSIAIEAIIHGRFSDVRIGKSENFIPNLDLIIHIKEVSKDFGVYMAGVPDNLQHSGDWWLPLMERWLP